jgi:hypothetical protein
VKADSGQGISNSPKQGREWITELISSAREQHAKPNCPAKLGNSEL